MKELYFCSVISNFGIATCLIGVVALIIFVGALIFYIAEDGCYDEDEDGKRLKTTMYASGIIGFVLILISIFTPSKADMYAIYGIGGTIDYIRQDSIAQQLPDKCIKAIDLYLDDMTKNENKE